MTEAGISLAFSVRNVGSRSGKAVPQVCITYPSDAGEPPAQLKAFNVVRLEPGEIVEVCIDMPLDDIAIFDDQSQSLVVRPGTYEIQAGVSSVDLRLRSTVQVG